MPEKFRNKYRIPSNRLRGWDYASSGHYYITIVTAGRDRLFGDIVNGEMVLNDLGQIVYDEFFKSFELREELFLGEFVLMPNHLHAIVILDKTKCMDDVVETSDHIETHDRVETHGRASLQSQSQHQSQNPQSPTTLQFQRQPQSISSFVAGFKSSTIKRIDDWIDSNKLPWRNSTRTILCGNRIIMTISFETKQNTDTFPITSSVIQWNGRKIH